MIPSHSTGTAEAHIRPSTGRPPSVAFAILSTFEGIIVNQYNQYNQNRGYNHSFSQSNFESEVEKACSILGVNKEDSFEIKKKRRNELLKKWHPDFYTDEIEKKKATEIINKINNAWEIIEKYHGVK